MSATEPSRRTGIIVVMAPPVAFAADSASPLPHVPVAPAALPP
ncbi:hypothetical protein [Streptomyces sp. NPDC054854]